MNGTPNSYLLDTNILIYYFNGNPTVQPIFNELFVGETIGFYSPITWVELLCYPALTLQEAEQIRGFLKTFVRAELTELVLNRAAQIRQTYRVPLPDAIIAACALETDSTLVTRNVKDFHRINSLTILNPFKA